MADDWRSEWSRHFDQIQWTATTILTAGVGGLLVYSFSTFSVRLSLIGLWLTLLTVYYAASFREFRRELHHDLPNADEKAFLTNTPRKRYLRQWPAFLTTFMLLTLAWLHQFWANGWRKLATALALGSSVVFVIAIRRGHLVMNKSRGQSAFTTDSD